MRVARTYLRLFLVPEILLVVSVLAWFYTPDSVSAAQGGLIGTVLGVGLSVSFVQSTKSLSDHKRRKKTFGLLKLITIPYLENRAKNSIETMKTYNDIDSLEKAVEFLAMSSHFDVMAQSFDKDWLQLIYSQEFLDTFNSKKLEPHFHEIAKTVQETLLTIDQLTAQSVNAKVNLMNDFSKMNDEHKKEFIKRARQIRDDVMDNAQKLQKCTNELDREIMVHLRENGVGYSEYER